MNIILGKQFYQYATVLLAAVLLLCASWWGYSSGRSAAEAKTVVADAGQIARALDLFYSDQDRFPTVAEFDDQNVMSHYIDRFPPQSFASKTCTSTYRYQRVSSRSYQLLFCLPAKSGNYQKGWNKIGKSK